MLFIVSVNVHCPFRPVLKKRHMLESKLEKAQRKCSEVADVVKGKTLNLVGERIEGKSQ